jgi:short-subunit dehydrogenase
MEVNFFGLLKTTQLFLPLLGADKNRKGRPGRVINISSVSGLKSFPFIGPYAASKHALEAISDSLRLELLMYGIEVIVIEPGNVLTPIWDKVPDLSIYKQTDYFPILSYAFNRISRSKEKSMSDVVIARVVHKALTKVKPKIRYLVVKNKFLNWTLYRLISDRMMERLYKSKLKKTRMAL